MSALSARDEVINAAFDEWDAYANRLSAEAANGMTFAKFVQDRLSAAGYVIVPREPTDEMIIAMMVHYEIMSHDPPAPNVAHVNAALTLASAPALKERVRESMAAAIRTAILPAKESEPK